MAEAGRTEEPDSLLQTFEETLANDGETIMTLKEHLINKGIEQGIERERKQSQDLLKQTALNFLKMGIPVEQVSQATNLSLQDVRELRDH